MLKDGKVRVDEIEKSKNRELTKNTVIVGCLKKEVFILIFKKTFFLKN